MLDLPVAIGRALSVVVVDSCRRKVDLYERFQVRYVFCTNDVKSTGMCEANGTFENQACPTGKRTLQFAKSDNYVHVDLHLLG